MKMILKTLVIVVTPPIDNMSDDSDISISEFHNSVSQFRRYEERALKIKIHSVEDFSKIVDTTDNVYTELELDEFDEGRIMTFSPIDYQYLKSSQKKFLNKLKSVMINNNAIFDESNFERLIDDLMLFLCEHMDFDDGEYLTMKPCNLRLFIANDSFAAYTDREGKRGTEIVWIMCEDKHTMSRSYKKGELQLIYCMIAAYQYNYSLLGKMYPPKMIGMRIVGYKFHFYCIDESLKYIEDLLYGLPKRELNVLKFPGDDGLSVANPNDRKDILKYMCSIRHHALSLEPKY
jgi:hypothetical protein